MSYMTVMSCECDERTELWCVMSGLSYECDDRDELCDDRDEF